MSVENLQSVDGSSSATATDEVTMRVVGVSKRYGAVQALRDVSFDCRAGEVHALLGANGSGKSTLLGIANGSRAADEGRVEIGGVALGEPTPARAHELGLAAVYQDNSLVLALTVADNLVLAALESDRPSYQRRAAWASAILERFALDIPADAVVSTLSPAQRQFLEIVKALQRRPKVLLLDEPTTALSPGEVTVLQRLVRSTAAEGTAVVYVSHRLPEVLELADRITVLRDGEVRTTVRNEGLVARDLVDLMLGTSVEHEYPPKAAPGDQAIELDVSELAGEGFGPVSLQIRAGEILGIAGAEGNGQREFVRGLAGLVPAEGRVTGPSGRHPLNNVRRILKRGTMLLSGDRHEESIFAAMTIRENMTIQVIDRFDRAGLIRVGAERREAQRLAGELALSPPNVELPVEALSGGNQQKVVMARSYLYPARVLMIDEPTQGVDAGARPEIYRVLRSRADAGAAVVVNSSDAAELAGLCDRVVVMSRGVIVAELVGDEVTEDAIVHSFVTTSDGRRTSTGDADQHSRWRRRWHRLVTGESLPLLLVVALIAALCLYTSTKSDAFMTQTNFRFMLTNLIPLGAVAAAQLCVLLIGGFDVSVGGVISLAVVMSSVFLSPDATGVEMALGVTLILVVALVTGLLNGTLIEGFNIVPIIATIGTLGILQGVSLWIRPVLGEPINRDWGSLLLKRVNIVPVALVVMVVLALVADHVLRRTALGLRVRATGLAPTAARRNGVPVVRYRFVAYMSAAVLAAVSGLLLGSQVGNGDPNSGNSFILVSFAACVLGGASLLGGRGTFLGALLGGFLIIVITKMPDFLKLDPSVGRMMTGALTLLAVILYSGRENWHRLKIYVRARRVARS